MGSDNPTGADNQQETRSCSSLELDARWVSGFVDGEGCFSVSIHRNAACAKRTGGWQILPSFQVAQHRRHRAVLEALVDFFGCGRVRDKGHSSSVLVYTAYGLADLEGCVIPRFESSPLVVKAGDFVLFTRVVRALRAKEHFTPSGFERIVRWAYGMNAGGKQRARPIEQILGSSETVRQARTTTKRSGAGAVKRQSDPHGDMGSQAEMT